MRLKKDKAAKTKVPSAKPSQTIKKRGRPALTPEQKAERAQARALAASAVNPVKKEKQSKKAVAEAFNAPVNDSMWDQTFTKIQVLQNMGAVHIKLDGVEVAFPVQTVTANGHFASAYNEAVNDSANQTPEEQIKQMAKVAEQDNPDQYAEQLDRWATHEPLPRI